MSLVKLVPVGRCCKRPCFLSRESVVGTQACIRLSCCGLCRVRLLVPTASHVRGIFGVPQQKTTPSASIRLRFFLSDLIDLHLFSRLASLTSTRLLCQTQHTQTLSSCPGSRRGGCSPSPRRAAPAVACRARPSSSWGRCLRVLIPAFVSLKGAEFSQGLSLHRLGCSCAFCPSFC